MFFSFDVLASKECIHEAFAKASVQFENHFDRVVRVLNVSGVVKERWARDLKVFQITDVFGEESPVFLGFGKPNVYLIVPGAEGEAPKRFAAKSVKRAPSVIEDTRGWAQSGLFIKFNNLPAEALEAIKASMLKHEGSRQWTCVNANCRVLNDAGFTVGGQSIEERYFPVSLMRSILSDGFEYNGVPVEFDVVRTTPLDIESLSLQIVKAELDTLRRHGSRFLTPLLEKTGVSAFWVFGKKNYKNLLGVVFHKKAPEEIKEMVEAITHLPAGQSYVSDINLNISETSKLGFILRTIWGPHNLFEASQTRISVDSYLRKIIHPFPNENPNFVTRLKKNFLFSKPVIDGIRSQLSASYRFFNGESEQTIFNALVTHTEKNQNKFNMVITGKKIIIARIQVRHKFIDWILTKHVLMSGYDPTEYLKAVFPNISFQSHPL